MGAITQFRTRVEGVSMRLEKSLFPKCAAGDVIGTAWRTPGHSDSQRTINSRCLSANNTIGIFLGFVKTRGKVNRG